MPVEHVDNNRICSAKGEIKRLFEDIVTGAGLGGAFGVDSGRGAVNGDATKWQRSLGKIPLDQITTQLHLEPDLDTRTHPRINTSERAFLSDNITGSV